MEPDDVERALRERIDPSAVVSDLRRLSGGASRETWSLDLSVVGGPAEPLILQRQRPGSTSQASIEAALLRAATAAGVPVPALRVDGSEDPGPIGAPYLVVERIEGESIPRKLLRDDEFAHARTVVTGQVGRALAAIHRIPVDAVPGLEHHDQLAQFRDILDSMGEPHPALELGFRRLESTRPPSTRTTIVHGDFRTGNLLLGPDGLRAVLDWEIAHLGDPMEDLGWFCARAWRFGSPHPAGGFGSYDELFDAYAAEAGEPVDPDVVRWWESVATLKWGVMCMMQARSHLLGLTRSVELAAIGRRVCENEHDLLVLLGSPLAPVVSDAPRAESVAPNPPHDRPTAAQLVEAVREFLERDVMDATTGRVQFHARVARNALAIVERELALGDSQAAAHRARLDALGFDDDRALAAAIRAGECDDRWDEVVASVHASVLDKLSVANPGYI